LVATQRAMKRLHGIVGMDGTTLKPEAIKKCFGDEFWS